MNIKEIYPLYIEQQLKAEFGESYQKVRQAYKDNRIEEFLQEFLLNPATNYYASTTTPKQIEATVQRFTSLFEWQKEKQIYKFDDELWSLLIQVDKLEIHCSVFQALPFQVFWIDRIFEHELNGCMVICNEDYIKLCFFAERNISYICLPFRDDVEGKTIEELIESHVNATISSEMMKWYTKNIRAALNAVIYLCTDKPDISTYQTELPVFSSPKANKSNNKKKKAEKKKNVTSISNVGLTIGRYIRETKRTVSSTTHTGNGSGSGTPKAPHMRKAHYHSFWTKDGDKKKLIVKFLSPILVNGGKADDIKPTIRVRRRR